MFEGIWCGVNGRTGEVFIGTKRGVVKCRTVRRLPEDQRWDATLLYEMEGTTWQPVLGHKSDHVPVEIHSDGNPISRAEEDEDAVQYEAVPIEDDATAAVRARSGNVTDIRVTHRDIEIHGATPGCPACRHIQDNTNVPRGVGHSAVCRKRVRGLVEINEDSRDRVERADQRTKKRGNG